MKQCYYSKKMDIKLALSLLEENLKNINIQVMILKNLQLIIISPFYMIQRLIQLKLEHF